LLSPPDAGDPGWSDDGLVLRVIQPGGAPADNLLVPGRGAMSGGGNRRCSASTAEQ
jgi:hypothetical protein